MTVVEFDDVVEDINHMPTFNHLKALWVTAQSTQQREITACQGFRGAPWREKGRTGRQPACLGFHGSAFGAK